MLEAFDLLKQLEEELMTRGRGGTDSVYLRYGSRLASNHSLENCRWSPSVARKTSFPALSMAARPNRSCREEGNKGGGGINRDAENHLA